MYTDETDSETDTASEGKVDSYAIDSKTGTASEGEVWDSCRIFCTEIWNYKNWRKQNAENI